MAFQLLETFKKKTLITELDLCSVIMEDKEFPWILLIPRVENVVQINQLSVEQQLQLAKEINFCSNLMEGLFDCDRLNVAAIGNKTPQLHVHIICRTETDSLWPETIWGREMRRLSYEENKDRANMIIKAFNKAKSECLKI
ncbi:MAG: HIT domain-containing protein [Alphaproteobacteria bacterium]|nr:HIT domain-containing protein [Alphaproteobacteria bacterium]